MPTDPPPLKALAILLGMVAVFLALFAYPVIATGEQGPPVPISEYQATTAADFAAGNAAGSVAAYAWMAQHDPGAVQYPSPALPAPPDKETTRVPGAVNATEDAVGGALRINWAMEPLHKEGAIVQARVSFLPIRLEKYSGVLRIFRYGPDGAPDAVGLPVYVRGIPALFTTAFVGAPCKLNQRLPRLFYIRFSFTMVDIHGGILVATRYSQSHALNC